MAGGERAGATVPQCRRKTPHEPQKPPYSENTAVSEYRDTTPIAKSAVRRLFSPRGGMPPRSNQSISPCKECRTARGGLKPPYLPKSAPGQRRSRSGTVHFNLDRLCPGVLCPPEAPNRAPGIPTPTYFFSRFGSSQSPAR